MMPWRGEAGFTLPELLVSVVILGIIGGALTGSVITGLKVTDGTSERIGESTDAQLASAYFAGDVQSATEVLGTLHPLCALPQGASAVVSFSWEDPTDSARRVASWFTRDVDGDRHLSRRYCEGGAVKSTVTVARSLGAAAPDLSCPGGCAGTPKSATLTVTEKSGFTFRLAGTRRAGT